MPRKLNIVTRLQHWMDSVPGQTFLNYAYSWGAAIVILGALFKLTHLKGGNLMLFLGMGTEAVVFFLAAFDRPFDKNEIGKELPRDFESDEEIECAEGIVPEEQLATSAETPALAEETAAAVAQTVSVQQPTVAPAAAYVAQPVSGVAYMAPQGGVSAPEGAGSQTAAAQSAENVAESAPQTQASAAPFVAAHYETPEGQRAIEEGAQRLAEIVRLANDELLRRTQAVLSPDMEAATEEYIEKLRTLNETLAKVDEQSVRLTRDSQEMENLNRTLIGINKVYDLHFASISRQVTTIEEINAQTRDLAAKIEEVNQIYARMVQTLNIMGNPYAAMGGVNAQPATAPAQPSPEAPTQPTSAS